MDSKIKMISNKIKEKKYLLFLIFTIWVGLEYIGAGPFSYIRIHDTGDSPIPLYLSFVQNIFKYGMTYWNQYAVCGIDRFANGPDIFHLNTLLFLIFPGWIAYQILVLLQLFMASYFTYRLCRDVLKLEEIPSIYAGIFFPLFFDELICFSLGIAGFPLLLWGMEKIYAREQKIKYLYIIILGALYSLSSSFTEVLPFVLPLALLWFVFVRRKYSLKFLIFFVVFCFSTAIWQIPTILALLKNTPLSHRAFWVIPDSITLDSLLAFFGAVRDYLMINRNGLIPISLAAIGIYFCKLKDRNFTIILSLLMVCAVIGPLTKPLSPYIDKMFPFLHGFQADRFYLLAPFFWAIVGAYGLHFIPKDIILVKKSVMGGSISDKKWKLQNIVGIILISLLICNTFIMKKDNAFKWLTGGNYFSNYQNKDLKNLANISEDFPFRVATVAYYLHPAYANAYGLETVDGYVVLYSKTYHNYWGKVIEPLTLQNKGIYHYFHDWGNRVYLFADDNFNELKEIVFSDYYNLDLLSLANTKYIISTIPLVNENLTLLSSNTSQDRVLFNELSTIEKGLHLIRENFKGRQLYIYENKNCLPRFFLINQIKVFENSNQLLNALSKADVKYLKNNLLIEKEFSQNLINYDLKNNFGEINVKYYSPDKIVLSVNLNGSMIVVASNNYSPYWKCKVDGEEKEIFPAYHTFWGIFLEGNGTKEVVFEYYPSYRIFK
jgi:hypothetical protein